MKIDQIVRLHAEILRNPRVVAEATRMLDIALLVASKEIEGLGKVPGTAQANSLAADDKTKAAVAFVSEYKDTNFQNSPRVNAVEADLNQIFKNIISNKGIENVRLERKNKRRALTPKEIEFLFNFGVFAADHYTNDLASDASPFLVSDDEPSHSAEVDDSNQSDSDSDSSATADMVDEEVAEAHQNAEEEARLAAEEVARVEAARVAEEARLAAEEAARVEAARVEEEARLAAEEAARVEAARVAEEARLAAEEAARVEAARVAEEARLAAEEAARVEAARVAAQQAADAQALLDGQAQFDRHGFVGMADLAVRRQAIVDAQDAATMAALNLAPAVQAEYERLLGQALADTDVAIAQATAAQQAAAVAQAAADAQALLDGQAQFDRHGFAGMADLAVRRQAIVDAQDAATMAALNLAPAVQAEYERLLGQALADTDVAIAQATAAQQAAAVAQAAADAQALLDGQAQFDRHGFAGMADLAVRRQAIVDAQDPATMAALNLAPAVQAEYERLLAAALTATNTAIAQAAAAQVAAANAAAQAAQQSAAKRLKKKHFERQLDVAQRRADIKTEQAAIAGMGLSADESLIYNNLLTKELEHINDSYQAAQQRFDGNNFALELATRVLKMQQAQADIHTLMLDADVAQVYDALLTAEIDAINVAINNAQRNFAANNFAGELDVAQRHQDVLNAQQTIAGALGYEAQAYGEMLAQELAQIEGIRHTAQQHFEINNFAQYQELSVRRQAVEHENLNRVNGQGLHPDVEQVYGALLGQEIANIDAEEARIKAAEEAAKAAAQQQLTFMYKPLANRPLAHQVQAVQAQPAMFNSLPLEHQQAVITQLPPEQKQQVKKANLQHRF